MKYLFFLPLIGVSVSFGQGAMPARAELRPPEHNLRPSGAKVVYSEQSPFGQVVVVERGDLRFLRFGAAEVSCGSRDCSNDQSVVSIGDATAVPMEYIRYATIGLAYPPRVKRLLMVGLGGGTFTTLVHRVRPDIHIDAVEVNPVVARIAQRYFRVKPDRRYRVHVADGRAFVDGVKTAYDLIMLDAYAADGIPAHLSSSDWFAAVVSKLSTSGVLVLNLSAQGNATEQILKRVHQQLPTLACFHTPTTHNLILVAQRRATVRGIPALVQRSHQLNQNLRLPFDLRQTARRLDMDCSEARARLALGRTVSTPAN